MAAEQTSARAPREAAGDSEQPQAEKKARWQRFLTKKWIAILLGASVVVQGAGLVYLQISRKQPAIRAEPEVPLGDFQFASDSPDGAKIARVRFGLYVTFLEHLDRVARDELAARRFRVQQAIEQLLRQAHSRDFEDPALEQLKRQIQEQINACLEMRAVAEVIIVNLRREAGSRGAVPAGVAVDAGPRTLP
jgi:flagellar basal body-associated protein FliL